MAVIQVGQGSECEPLSFQGGSGDTMPDYLKPINSGSSYYNVDTKESFVWHINAWKPL